MRVLLRLHMYATVADTIRNTFIYIIHFAFRIVYADTKRIFTVAFLVARLFSTSRSTHIICVCVFF